MGYVNAEGFTVRVLRADLSGAAGVGFVVSDGRIVTCAHVVNVALGRDKSEQTEPESDSVIMVDFPLTDDANSATRRKCKLAAWRPPPPAGAPPQDLAGLELVDGAVPENAGPARVMDPTAARNVPVQIFGYPVIPKDPRPDGVWARLKLVGRVGGGLIQLDDDGDAAYRAEEGFSGSPVVARDAAGDAVIGVFALASASKQAKDSRAIPVSAVVTAWPEAVNSDTITGPLLWDTGYGAPTSGAAASLARHGILLPSGPGPTDKPIHELLSGPPDLFGREAESKLIIDWLDPRAAGRLVNIYGIPGSGKTALALYVAHAVADQHPDCQLYFNLRASDQSLVPPEELLGGKLVSLGMQPAELPSGLQARAEAYRSLLWGRRPLIVIENVTSADLATPLLPDTSGAAVIITSWVPITNIPGLTPLRVESLGDAAALAMLASAASRQIAAADRGAARRVARFLGNLPLALLVAGGVLRKREHWSWQTLYDRLRAEAANLQVKPVVIGDPNVQASFGLAYRELDPATALGYRLLGLAPSARMSQGLAQTLISEDLFEAHDIVDQLVEHQLLQPESAPDAPGQPEASVFRMHDLLWLRARSLVSAAADQEAREAAVQRMTKWSLAQLGTLYLDHLKSSLTTLPSVLDHDKHMSLPDTYIDSTVVSADPLHSAIPADTLSGVFPDPCPRLVLMAPGGSGKTTMARHLCLTAASQGPATPDHGIIPLIILIRDIYSETEETSLESLIIRTLRYRYVSEVTPEALRVALDSGRAFVVADGLDEVVPALRQRVTASINEFADRYPQVPVLVTTRPFAATGQAFPAFTVATIAPWTVSQATAYLEKLARRHSLGDLTDWLAEQHDLGLIGTPLGLQLLLGLYRETSQTPETFTFLVEGILQLLLRERESSRGITWQGRPDELRDTLERAAFAMQSNPDSQIAVTGREVESILGRHVSFDHPQARLGDYIIPSARFGVMAEIGVTEGGERLFAFTHTAFREHLAASHIARMPLLDAAAVMQGNYTDPSWDAVFVAAFELAGQTWSNAWKAPDNPALRDAIRSWARRAGKRPPF